MKINLKINFLSIRLIFFSIILVELISYLGYFFPIARELAFFALILGIFILAFIDLKYALALATAELIIGSKGWLFYFGLGSFSISIRVAIWLVIMLIWFIKAIFYFYKNYNKNLSFRKNLLAAKYLEFFSSSYFLYFSVLFLAIIWGARTLFISNFGEAFFDFNAWVFFSYIFPVFAVFKTHEDFDILKKFILAGFFALLFKTFAMFFIFSHFNFLDVYGVYRWLRETGVGEVTDFGNGFYRVFFQSHIYAVFALFASLAFLIGEKNYYSKKILKLFLISSASLAVIILSFSRSFWVGTAGALVLFILFTCLMPGRLFLKIIFKNFLRVSFFIIISALVSFILILFLAKFPYPTPRASFGADIFSDRAGDISGEAAASSRWSLLPLMAKEIIARPITGWGFGKTITYRAFDPRILESNPQGLYTTSAFEWGWLDIWLKLGLIGLLAYIILLIKIFFSSLFVFYKQSANISNNYFGLAIALGVAALCAINIFTPYLNHPLGIGAIILAVLLLDKRFFESA